MRVDKIKEKYDIKSDDLKIIFKELTNRLKSEHPDCKSGDDAECKELIEDRDYIRELISNGAELLVIEEMRSFVRMVQDNQMMVKQDIELHNKLVNSLNAQMNKFRKNYKHSKYSLAAITAIFTFIWFMPEKIISHPIIKFIMEISDVLGDRESLMFFGVSWICLLMITFHYWTMIAKIEQKEKNILDEIKLESVQNEIFMRYIQSFGAADRFSKKQFMDYVGNELNKESKYKRTGITEIWNAFNRLLRIQLEIGEDILQSVADLILHRAVEHGLIEKTDAPSLIDYYVIKK